MKKLLLSLSALAFAGVMQAQTPTWVGQETNAPAMHYPYAISLIDANTVWFADNHTRTATDTGKYSVKTTNGGATWTTTAINGLAPSATVGDFSAVDANNAWLVSSGIGMQNGIWKTSNGGTSWTKQASAAYGVAEDSFANIVYFWDANEGIAAGDPVNGVFEMYKTMNGGNSWTKLASAPASEGDYGYTHVRFVRGNSIWMGTDTGRLLYSPDRGATWQSFQSPATDFGGITVEGSSATLAFKDDNNGLIITNDNDILGLWETSDKGATWTEIATPVGSYYGGDVKYVPGTDNTYVTTGGEGSSFSVDGGKTWTEFGIESGTSPYKGAAIFLNSSVGYAGGLGQAMDNQNRPIKEMYKMTGALMAVSDVNSLKGALTIANNPVGDKVELKSKKEIVTSTVIDMAGKTVKREDAATFNVSNLSKGTYIIQVKYKDGSFENTKMIKK